jgi:hypothetical protein
VGRRFRANRRCRISTLNAYIVPHQLHKRDSGGDHTGCQSLKAGSDIYQMRFSLARAFYPLLISGFLAAPVASDSCAALGTVNNAD